jgi:hypothetical protein
MTSSGRTNAANTKPRTIAVIPWTYASYGVLTAAGGGVELPAGVGRR